MLIFVAGGIEEGSDHRLPNGYEVRKKTAQQAGSFETVEGKENEGNEA